MTTAAVIGCGDVSAAHLVAIDADPDIELVAVCDTDPDRREAAARRWDVPGFADHLSLLTEVRPDVVHVSTPHHQHVPVALDALAAGVDVLTEKPVAHRLADGERLVEASARALRTTGARLGVCYQNRYNATSQRIQELLDSGELGTVKGGSATVMWSREPAYYEARPWRAAWDTSGGGLLINQAIHTIDLLQWLLGPVTEVRGHAVTHRLADVIEVEDTAEAAFWHEGGARSVFYATNNNPVHDPVTLEIATENATLALRGDLTITWADGRVETVREREASAAGRAYWGSSHGELIADFHAGHGSGEPFWIGAAEAMASLRILKDIYAQSGDALPAYDPAMER
jgi:UDP-N-acetyl-2-amino-2-deoxyglucuronate dehydrogenase